jgi:C4-dicarboxylate-specific signal transduction histidine kinase
MESKKAAFMGKITAGVTHEMKNVLAIIKESAGLMEDLITFSKENSIPHQDRLMRALSRIGEQVTRGVDLSTRLNTFAHTSDEAVSSVDLNYAMVQAAFLCGRFARLKGLTLEAQPGDGAVIVVTDPMALQMLLFECVNLVMSFAPSGSAIRLLSAEADRKGINVEIAVEGAANEVAGECNPAGLPGWPMALEIARGLGVALEACGPSPRITVRFP